jgi:hypothetical protein
MLGDQKKCLAKEKGKRITIWSTHWATRRRTADLKGVIHKAK